MATGQVQGLQLPVQPTVIVANTSSPTRYKSYNSRVNVTLGIIQIVCGVLIMGFSVALIAVDSPGSHISDGIWCGLIIILSGSFQIAAGRTKTKCWIVTSLVFAILAALFVIPVLVIGPIGTLCLVVTRDREDSYNNYWRYYHNYYDPYYDVYRGPYYDKKPWGTIYVLNGLQLLIAVVQGIIAIIASVMACGPPCCNKTQTTTVAQHQVHYVANQPGQVITITQPAVTNQPVLAVPAQQGFTAPALTSFGEPPRYTTAPGAQIAPQGQPMYESLDK